MSKRKPQRPIDPIKRIKKAGAGSVAEKQESSRPGKSSSASSASESAKAWREAIESIVVAIVLAFLFRAFEAEAFVIPTGSMAPTLQGRHKDVECPECGYRYQAGASVDAEADHGRVQAVKCPMCFYTQEIDPRNWSHVSHTGDRILVNKFAYEEPFGDPKRWDVIVFKYPGNAKQNYIKRLVGLDEETIRIRHGDIFKYPAPGAQGLPLDQFQIVRKPPGKLKHMLQLVADTEYRSQSLALLDWPLNWQPEGNTAWQVLNDGKQFHCAPSENDVAWLNYRHYYLDFFIWEALGNGEDISQPAIVPITDFYAYNAQSRDAYRGFGKTYHPRSVGNHWVGDLALEAEVEVNSQSGTLWLDLVEAGRHHRCAIDIASGQARLMISDSDVIFESEDGTPVGQPTAQTALRGPGGYEIRYANCDNQVLLWIDDELCQFDVPTTYSRTPDDRPVANQAGDAGDLQPVRIGAAGVELTVNRLRLLRDIYYAAATVQHSRDQSPRDTDYKATDEMVIQHLLRPQRWRPGDIFDKRQTVTFSMEKDQFFALGDNSPASKDSRLWDREHFVEREMLIGKAVLIYWPHPWRIGIPGTTKSWPLLPNFRDMGLIH